MSKEITTPQLCVLLRGEVELWIPEDRLKELRSALADKNKRFLTINGQLVNSFEITGVFGPEYMEERTRRKNGEWKCKKGYWHEKFEKCSCGEYSETVTAHVQGIGEVKYKR